MSKEVRFSSDARKAIILRARIVAVVVPSPATSLVLFATSYTNLAKNAGRIRKSLCISY